MQIVQSLFQHSQSWDTMEWAEDAPPKVLTSPLQCDMWQHEMMRLTETILQYREEQEKIRKATGVSNAFVRQLTALGREVAELEKRRPEQDVVQPFQP